MSAVVGTPEDRFFPETAFLFQAFIPVKEIPRLFQNQNPVEGYQVKDNIRGIVTIFGKTEICQVCQIRLSLSCLIILYHCHTL